MGYFTKACRYCNGDIPDCTCHSLTIEDIQEGRIISVESVMIIISSVIVIAALAFVVL